MEADVPVEVDIRGSRREEVQHVEDQRGLDEWSARAAGGGVCAFVQRWLGIQACIREAAYR